MTNMETTKKKEPIAYIFENGVKKLFKYQKTSDKLSPIGVWLMKHPNGVGKILDMKAVMK